MSGSHKNSSSIIKTTILFPISHETNSHLHTIFENDAIKTRVLQRVKFEVEKLRVKYTTFSKSYCYERLWRFEENYKSNCYSKALPLLV